MYINETYRSNLFILRPFTVIRPLIVIVVIIVTFFITGANDFFVIFLVVIQEP